MKPASIYKAYDVIIPESKVEIFLLKLTKANSNPYGPMYVMDPLSSTLVVWPPNFKTIFVIYSLLNSSIRNLWLKKPKILYPNLDNLKYIKGLGKNSEYSIDIIVNVIVNINGNNLNSNGTANSVSRVISWEGWINNPLSIKNPVPNPINISLLIYPKKDRENS